VIDELTDQEDLKDSALNYDDQDDDEENESETTPLPLNAIKAAELRKEKFEEYRVYMT